jgi:hypothetical protein
MRIMGDIKVLIIRGKAANHQKTLEYSNIFLYHGNNEEARC